MKTFSIVHVLLLILLMLVYQCSHAQDYAVTNRGDTLRGEVKIFNTGSEKRVTVDTGAKKKQSVPFFQVRNFVYKGELYRPVKGPNGFTFMKVIVDGYLSLFAFQGENQVNFDEFFLEKRDGSPGIIVPNLNFKKALKKFLEECSAVTAKIEDGTYGRRDIVDIVNHYNQCTSAPRIVELKPAEPQPQAKAKNTTAWDQLEQKIASHADFNGKADAKEMVVEIKNKLSRGEKVPNFMIEGLKSALSGSSLTNELNAALSELK